MSWKGRRVALVGLGISNVAVARYLTDKGAVITACDQKDQSSLGQRYQELSALGVEFQLGRGYLDNLERFEYLMLAPGVPIDLPPLVEARRRGVVLSSEMSLFFSECRAPIIGITGSAGKTTTTLLLAEILLASGVATHVGGNIGKPLLEQVDALSSHTWVLLELSSFQLQLLQRSPRIALMTNVSPNHLDVHGSMDEYVAAKKNIFRFQGPQDWLVLNYDNETTRLMSTGAPGQLVWFSRTKQPRRGACVIDQRVMISRAGHFEEVCHVPEIRLLGTHNLENVLAAVATADLVDCSAAVMHDVITSFAGVEHRLEFVQELDGVLFYNDSKATTPTGTMAALHSFSRPVVLIAGGYDKHLPFDEMAEVAIDKARAIILLGATQEKIAVAIHSAADRLGQDAPPISRARDLEEAVDLARAHAKAGDAVLLSPACASYDMFHSYEERGTQFREIVRSLVTPHVTTRPQR